MRIRRLNQYAALFSGNKRPRQQPQRYQEQVDDAMEGLGRVHWPGDGKTERSQANETKKMTKRMSKNWMK